MSEFLQYPFLLGSVVSDQFKVEMRANYFNWLFSTSTSVLYLSKVSLTAEQSRIEQNEPAPPVPPDWFRLAPGRTGVGQ